ncbi:MAG: hypothetical protein Q4B85_14150 [Lachnospiraceae bacterium]|nr:hypothetical protein [Lachnospiraceae bacterium]
MNRRIEDAFDQLRADQGLIDHTKQWLRRERAAISSQMEKNSSDTLRMEENLEEYDPGEGYLADRDTGVSQYPDGFAVESPYGNEYPTESGYGAEYPEESRYEEDYPNNRSVEDMDTEDFTFEEMQEILRESKRDQQYQQSVAREKAALSKPVQERTVQKKAPQKRRVRRKRSSLLGVVTAVAATSVCIVTLLLLGLNFRLNSVPDSYISIDVNPSIELCLNRKDEVLSAEAWNEDGAAILSGLQMEGCTWEEALNCLLGSDAFLQYLTEDSDLTITVIGGSRKRAEELEAMLQKNLLCTQYHATTAQTVQSMYQEAHRNGMSFGKYCLYKELCKLDASADLEECRGMTMRQLRDRIFECQNAVDNSPVDYDSDGSTGVDWNRCPYTEGCPNGAQCDGSCRDENKGKCPYTKDCPNGAKCDGSCRDENKNDGKCPYTKDCPNGAKCDGSCRDENKNGGKCPYTKDCPNGAKCDGSCQSGNHNGGHCPYSEDCPNGAQCDGSCQSGNQNGGHCPYSEDCPNGSQCDGSCVRNDHPEGDHNGGPGNHGQNGGNSQTTPSEEQHHPEESYPQEPAEPDNQDSAAVSGSIYPGENHGGNHDNGYGEGEYH